MFHDLIKWLQDVPGATGGDPTTSWSQQLLSSLNLWALIEGSHVLVLMLFVGTIMLVDLRMLGLAFKKVSISSLSNKLLPMTVTGFVLIAITGVLLFAAKPLHYYHSVWFRAKLIVLFLAAINIFWFHYRVQRNQGAWDALPSPPAAVKAAAAISLGCWALMIVLGRLIAFTWYDCENLKPNTFGYAFAECAPEMRDRDNPSAALPASTQLAAIPPSPSGASRTFASSVGGD